MIEFIRASDRNITAAACPKCNGYADCVTVTKDEISKYQKCGRIGACCIKAFVCRVCKQRIIADLPSPEME